MFILGIWILIAAVSLSGSAQKKIVRRGANIPKSAFEEHASLAAIGERRKGLMACKRKRDLKFPGLARMISTRWR
jgi:hypothetical protein